MFALDQLWQKPDPLPVIEQLFQLELETCFTNERGFTEIFTEVDGL